jgi:hypothetical protein
MPGFEVDSPSTTMWVGLIRDLVATSATPLDLSVDRLGDLLVLTSLVVSNAAEAPGDGRFSVAVGVEDARIVVDVTSRGEHHGPAGQVSDVALSVLADEHWAHASTDGHQVGFAIAL